MEMWWRGSSTAGTSFGIGLTRPSVPDQMPSVSPSNRGSETGRPLGNGGALDLSLRALADPALAIRSRSRRSR